MTAVWNLYPRNFGFDGKNKRIRARHLKFFVETGHKYAYRFCMKYVYNSTVTNIAATRNFWGYIRQFNIGRICI
jgi:hypothetical protein